MLILVLILIAGLVLLVAGAEVLVSGASALARRLGVQPLIVGLTIVAAGTSLPELAASVMASWRGEDDIAVGNVTGSNIFNILLILGLCALLHPLEIERAAAARDIGTMLLASVALVPIMRTGFVISRLEGAAPLGAYAGYVAALATGWTPGFG